jgi:hypothetical protein
MARRRTGKYNPVNPVILSKRNPAYPVILSNNYYVFRINANKINNTLANHKHIPII